MVKTLKVKNEEFSFKLFFIFFPMVQSHKFINFNQTTTPPPKNTRSTWICKTYKNSIGTNIQLLFIQCKYMYVSQSMKQEAW